MGTLVSIRVASMAPGRAGEEATAIEAAFDEIRRIERVLSDRDGELARVSERLWGGGSIPVSPDLASCLRSALEASAASDGAFDPTLGNLTRVWGFWDAPYGPIPSPERIAGARAGAGWRRIACDDSSVSLRGLEPPPRLDLGGIGKGYAADAAARVLAAHGVASAIVDLGGNLRTLGRHPDGGPWRIGVRHPREEGKILGVLAVTGDAGIATSADSERFFLGEDGLRYHHVLDPKTGRPARGMVSVTVVAGDATTAEAWDNTAFVIGWETAPAVLAARNLRAVLVREGTGGRMEVAATPGLDWTIGR